MHASGKWMQMASTGRDFNDPYCSSTKLAVVPSTFQKHPFATTTNLRFGWVPNFDPLIIDPRSPAGDWGSRGRRRRKRPPSASHPPRGAEREQLGQSGDWEKDL